MPTTSASGFCCCDNARVGPGDAEDERSAGIYPAGQTYLWAMLPFALQSWLWSSSPWAWASCDRGPPVCRLHHHLNDQLNPTGWFRWNYAKHSLNVSKAFQTAVLYAGCDAVAKTCRRHANASRAVQNRWYFLHRRVRDQALELSRISRGLRHRLEVIHLYNHRGKDLYRRNYQPVKSGLPKINSPYRTPWAQGSWAHPSARVF